MTKISRFGSPYPILEGFFHPNLSINMWPWWEAYYPRRYATAVLWTMIDMTGPSESGLCMMLRNTTTVLNITLGFMIFGFWHERDSCKGRPGGGGGYNNLATFSNRNAQNWGAKPHVVYNAEYHPKQEIFIMKDTLAWWLTKSNTYRQTNEFFLMQFFDKYFRHFFIRICEIF